LHCTKTGAGYLRRDLAFVKANVAVHNREGIEYSQRSMLVVKKYPNRRLYDTAESRYITLEDLASRIKAGSDVLVQDATSGADLTQATLTQIILESRGGARLLPVPLLLRLIRLGDEALAEFLGRYVSWALEMYLQAQHGARALMPMNPLANAPFAATNALARLVLGATKWGSQAAQGNAPSPAAQPQPFVPQPDTYGGPIPEPPPSEPMMPHMPTGEEVAAAIEAETAHVHGEVSDVADDVARLRREIEALKRSMATSTRETRGPRDGAKAGRAPRATRKVAPKVAPKKR
jgi:polyhydroxyalkanoate synthesis repressor PhaR